MIADISVVIPTYKREKILLDTIEYLLKQEVPAKEILIVDQTPRHIEAVEKQLRAWDSEGRIKWIHRKEPSPTKAMNYGLIMAKSNIVLFLDDDIIPSADLIRRHIEAHNQDKDIWAIVGRITQPWHTTKDEEDIPDRQADGYFNFNSPRRQFIQDAMGGNLSVVKDKFIKIGGFDENFTVYKFETEFAERLTENGGKILFEPSAGIKHLKAKEGGSRVLGDHNTTVLPIQSVGAYYYFFRSKKVKLKLLESMKRWIKSIYTRHHLRKPWWIPATLMAEFLGFWWAVFLFLKGPKLIKNDT